MKIVSTLQPSFSQSCRPPASSPRLDKADCKTQQIVPASPASLDILTALYADYLDGYGKKPPQPEIRRYLQQRLEQDKALIYVGYNNNRPVGFMVLTPKMTSIEMKPMFVLQNLYVAPQARQNGIGAALVKKAQLIARDTGAWGLELKTSPNNTLARKLYEQSGFREDGLIHYQWQV